MSADLLDVGIPVESIRKVLHGFARVVNKIFTQEESDYTTTTVAV